MCLHRGNLAIECGNFKLAWKLAIGDAEYIFFKIISHGGNIFTEYNLLQYHLKTESQTISTWRKYPS
jgi:hypothetical protein